MSDPIAENTQHDPDPAGQWGELIEFPRPRQDTGQHVEHQDDGVDNTVEFPPVNSADSADGEQDQAGELVVRPDATPARRAGGIPPALASTGRVAWQTTKATGRGTVWAARAAAPHAKAAGVATVRVTRRHGSIVRAGLEQQRQQRKRNTSDMQAARAVAVAQGDYQAVQTIDRQLRERSKLSAERVQAQAGAVWDVLRKTAIAIVILLGVALVAGLVNSVSAWFRADGGLLGDWTVLDVLATLGTVLTGIGAAISWSVANIWWLAPTALAVTTAVWLSRRWRDGHQLGESILPSALRKGDSVEYTALDEGVIASALANIGLTALRTAAKEGWPNRETDRAWVQWPVMEGNGVSASLRLPGGAPVAEVEKRKTALAHNLGCLPAELFLEKGDDPTVLDLFRLNPGELRKKVPQHPILAGDLDRGDFFTGVPVGITPRGTPVKTQLFERNYVISGIMGSGKSTLVLNILAGVLTDPIVDVDVLCFGENADYDPWRDLLSTFVMGDTDDTRDTAEALFDWLIEELNIRGKLLQKHGIKKVTREAAEKEPGLRPRVVVLDECQGYFRVGTPDERRQRADKLIQLMSAARKYGIVLVFVTPVPSDKALPRDLVAAITNRACFAIGDKTRNNVVLGEKAHENGISALGLKPADEDELNDVGTAITIGFAKGSHETLRSYFLDDKKGEDTELAAIAREVRFGRAEQDPADLTPEEPPEQRDLLVDLDQVLGDERVKLSDVPAKLRELAPKWKPYAKLDGATLGKTLRGEHDVPTPKPGNVPHLDPSEVRAALNVQRAAQEADSESPQEFDSDEQ